MKKLFIVVLATVLVCTMISFTRSWQARPKVKRSFYQLVVYRFTNGAQETILDKYLQNALLPALHKLGKRNIGVFKNRSNDTIPDKTLYVLVPLQSLEDVTQVADRLNADKNYQAGAKEYIDASYTSPPYSRVETILLQAFSLAPELRLPELNGPRRDRVYELRSYESATEKIFRNKVKMFNDGDEIGLFKRLNFNATFYGEVIAGSKMPNLMYMTCHANKATRDANWKAFVDDPYWKKLSSMSEYQHNVSHIDISFLYPTEYSDY